MPAAAFAQTTVTVTTETQLRAALTSAADGDVIQLQSNITLSADLPTINAGITVNGGGFTLSGSNQYRGLAIVPGGGVVPTAISVTIADLTIANTLAAGGAGGTGAAGGGGGAGLGGALFIGALLIAAFLVQVCRIPPFATVPLGILMITASIRNC